MGMTKRQWNFEDMREGIFDAMLELDQNYCPNYCQLCKIGKRRLAHAILKSFGTVETFASVLRIMTEEEYDRRFPDRIVRETVETSDEKEIVKADIHIAMSLLEVDHFPTQTQLDSLGMAHVYRRVYKLYGSNAECAAEMGIMTAEQYRYENGGNHDDER